MSRFTPTYILLATVVGFASPAQGDDVKDAINHSIRAIRATQNGDGSYGPEASRVSTTSKTLLALGSCEESYTVFDGPFVRRAVDALLSAQADDGSFGDVELTRTAVLSLAAASPGANEESVRAALAFLAKHGSPLDDPSQHMPGKGSSRTFVIAVAPNAGAADADLGKIAKELAADQERGIAGLSADGVPAILPRLLALIDVQSALSGGSREEAPLPEVGYREPPKNADERQARIVEGLEFLAKSQKEGRFGFGASADAGITAIALSAVIKTCDSGGLPRPKYVAQGLDYLLSLQKENGGIYDQGLANYVTSIAIEAMVASGESRFEEAIARGVTFLTSTQLDEDEGYSSEEDPYYGGFGYGSSEKPDLSNTQMAVQALHDANLDPDHEAWSKVVSFLARCQNLPESGAPANTNGGKTIVPGDDGGAVYRPGNSKAGETPVDGDKYVANSYGSMTYALLKSYLFAGLDPNDDRVAAAIEWICKNYTLEVNPGFTGGRKNTAYQGLFYYYLTMARTLKTLGRETLVDGAGKTRNWRQELEEVLFGAQGGNGEWINIRSSRWMEGSPILTTSYALLTLVETG